MSATVLHPSIGAAAAGRTLRFGAASEPGPGFGEHSVQWLLKRNCSATPRQMVLSLALLCLISLGIGGWFWTQGATLVMPFAWIEVIAIGAALVVYSRHATDRETIRLRPGRLTVELVFGRHTERVEFAPAWVRVEPQHFDRSLIELSGQGQRISVGRFVRPELRRQLADELRWTLRRWQWVPGSVPAGSPQRADAQANQDKFDN